LREEVEKWEGPGGGDQLDAFLAYVFLFYARWGAVRRADGIGKDHYTPHYLIP
jgi:hypothetical protein